MTKTQVMKLLIHFRSKHKVLACAMLRFNPFALVDRVASALNNNHAPDKGNKKYTIGDKNKLPKN